MLTALCIATPFYLVSGEEVQKSAYCQCNPCTCKSCSCGMQCECCKSDEACKDCPCECTKGKECACDKSEGKSCCIKNS